MRKTVLTIILASVLPMISSCKGEDRDRNDRLGSEIRAESFCNAEGFSNPLRETFVLIDAKVMKKTNSAKEFAIKNEWLRDILLDVADPTQSLASGFMIPRERVSIIVLPANGSTGVRSFSGCLPGFTAEERESIAADSSALEEFFTGTNESELGEAQSSFRTRLIGGLQSAASLAAENTGRQTGKLQSSPFMEAFRSTQGLFDTTNESKRFVLISDFSGIQTKDSDDDESAESGGNAFNRAIQDARQSAARFDRSEIYLIQPPNTKMLNKDYLRGFFLAQGGDLVSSDVGRTGLAAAAPTRFHRFEGRAEYPSGAQPLQIVLAADKEGKLVQSWIVLLGEEPQPIPIAGRMRCTGDTSCSIVSEPQKFAQSWSADPGGEPEFSNDMPFGGMRNFELSFEGGKLKGRVTDPAVGDVGNGQNFIVVTGKIIEEESE